MTYNTTSSKPFDLIDQALKRASAYERRLIELEPCPDRSRLHLDQMDYWWDLAVKLDEESRR